MTTAVKPPHRSAEFLAGGFLVVLSLSFALVLGNPGLSGIPTLVIALTATVAALILAQVYAGYLIMVACCFTFAVVAVTPDRYVNAFDCILLFMFPFALMGTLRRRAHDESRALAAGPGHDRIREATRRFIKAVVIFYTMAAVSIIQVVFRIGASAALTSALLLIRTVEGALLFPLGLWWLRSERRMNQLVGAAVVGGFLLAGVMLTDRLTIGTTRPGMTWILNQPGHLTEDPNQAGLNFVLLMALVFAHHPVRPRFWNYLLMPAGITALVLSQSRSGVLAATAFLVLGLQRIRVRYVVYGLLMLGVGAMVSWMLPTVSEQGPGTHDFGSRIMRTVSMQRGSPELYSWMLRVYGYLANVRVFIDNWLFGVGFFAAQFVSPRYNELGVPLGAENYFLETATGMGVIGLGVLFLVLARMFELGKVVGEVAPTGTLASQLARYHRPLIVGMLVVCLTGNTLVGVIANAQLGIWCALMVRAAHLSLRDPTAS